MCDSEWDRESVDRLNASLMNINDRLWELIQDRKKDREVQEDIAGSLRTIEEIMMEQDIVCEERKKKEELLDKVEKVLAEERMKLGDIIDEDKEE